MNKFAIIVAGGSGTRMGSKLPKQFLLVNNRPVLLHAVAAFLECYEDLKVILVLPVDYMEAGTLAVDTLPGKERVLVTGGGRTRFHSVQNGLAHVPLNAIVFVHDAVRCLVTHTLIRRCYEATLAHANAIPAVSVTDSLRLQTDIGSEVIDRTMVRAVQTPQTFFSDTIKKAFEQPYQESFTDEASVVEQLGAVIHLVEGDVTNIKITRPVDLVVAEAILAAGG